MPLRLLLYIGEVYDRCRRQNPKAEKLPFVFPIVFYHGKRKWNAPNNFRELVDIPEYLQEAVQAFVPDFSYRLEDLGPYSDEALRQLQLTECARVVLSVLKHIFDEDLAAKLPEMLGDLTPWFATIKGFEEFAVVLRYIVDTSESVEPADLDEWRKRLSPNATGVIMTLADQLRAEGHAKGRFEGRSEGRAEGRSEGRAEGRSEGRAESIVNILTVRGLDVSEETRETILSCREESILDRWLRRALTVEVSGDIFRDG
jgi:hypothetical protein